MCVTCWRRNGQASCSPRNAKTSRTSVSLIHPRQTVQAPRSPTGRTDHSMCRGIKQTFFRGRSSLHTLGAAENDTVRHGVDQETGTETSRTTRIVLRSTRKYVFSPCATNSSLSNLLTQQPPRKSQHQAQLATGVPAIVIVRSSRSFTTHIQHTDVAIQACPCQATVSTMTRNRGRQFGRLPVARVSHAIAAHHTSHDTNTSHSSETDEIVERAFR